MALFALTAGIVVANSDGLTAAFRHSSPEDATRQAFSAARRHALDTHGEVTLRIVDGELRVTDSRGEPAGNFPALAKDADRTLTFLADDGTRPADAASLSSLRFTAEGTVSPVRIRLATKSSGKVRVWRADPFSAILNEESVP